MTVRCWFGILLGGVIRRARVNGKRAGGKEKDVGEGVDMHQREEDS